MIRPAGFKANVETMEDNYFQHPNDAEYREIESRALQEFEQMTIQLKEVAGQRLTAVTTSSQGKLLVCQAFGRVVDAVMIDRPVNDRTIIVWKGLTLDEIRELDKVVPRIGEKKK